ncbi:MAG: DUF4345 family protein [Halieaceae bacterium]|nr:DUF4345 family protein [Halieaceae bacterium]
MDALLDWLPRLGALLQLLIGVVGFFKPRAFTEQMQLVMSTPMAVSEVRTVFGGLNLGVGLAALLMQEPLVYMALGMAWFFGLLARFYSMAVDKTSLRDSMPGITVDAVLSFLYLSGLLFG